MVEAGVAEEKVEVRAEGMMAATRTERGEGNVRTVCEEAGRGGAVGEAYVPCGLR